MNNIKKMSWLVLLAAIVLSSVANPALAGKKKNRGPVCDGLPSYDELQNALGAVVTGGGNAGLGNDMWATLVDRDGVVCAVTFSGDDSGDQWPGSRVISAQKASTANAFSLPPGAGGLPGLALSTANLWSATQPGGSLFGLQFSNPVSGDVAYGAPSAADTNTKNYGKPNDPMVGRIIGGVNVFGGGLALYNDQGDLLGALGLSGDTSCSDHIQAWKVRHMLGLDYVPAGVAPTPGAFPSNDQIIFDLQTVTIDGEERLPQSASGFGHPHCLDAAAEDTAVGNLDPTQSP